MTQGTINEEDYKFTDQGNAELFCSQHAGIARFNHAERRWLIWDGRRWKSSQGAEVVTLAVSSIKSLFNEAQDCSDRNKAQDLSAWASKSLADYKIRGMLNLAQAIVPIATEQLDTHKMLLNVGNGVVDLTSGQLLAHDPELYLSKIAPVEYGPNAECPLWLGFLGTITDGSKEMVRYLQKVVGYSLTGRTDEQCMFILYGDGCNGKTTFITTLLTMLGSYGINTPTETLMVQNRDGIRNDIMRLKGMRFVAASEGKRHQALDESMIKQITGGDKVSARALYKEYEDFEPEGKVFFATNYKPEVKGADHGIWRRLRPVPFLVRISEKDKDPKLPSKLLAETSGILRWAVEGCLLWQREGLKSPQVVDEALRQYKSEQDVLSEFIESKCVSSPGSKIRKSELHRHYQAYCAASGADFSTMNKLRKELIQRGFTERNYNDGSYWMDVVVTSQVQLESVVSG